MSSPPDPLARTGRLQPPGPSRRRTGQGVHVCARTPGRPSGPEARPPAACSPGGLRAWRQSSRMVEESRSMSRGLASTASQASAPSTWACPVTSTTTGGEGRDFSRLASSDAGQPGEGLIGDHRVQERLALDAEQRLLGAGHRFHLGLGELAGEQLGQQLPAVARRPPPPGPAVEGSRSRSPNPRRPPLPSPGGPARSWMSAAGVPGPRDRTGRPSPGPWTLAAGSRAAHLAWNQEVNRA